MLHYARLQALPGLLLGHQHAHACELRLQIVPLCRHGPRERLPELRPPTPHVRARYLKDNPCPAPTPRIASCMASESVCSQRGIASCGSASTHAGSCHREWVCADTLVRRGEIEARMHLRGPQELCVWIAQGRQHAAQRLVCGRLAVQAAASPLQAHPLIRDSDFPLTSTSQLPLSWPPQDFWTNWSLGIAALVFYGLSHGDVPLISCSASFTMPHAPEHCSFCCSEGK